MASSAAAKLPYRRLKHEGGFEAEHTNREKGFFRSKRWIRLKRGRIRRRFRLKIPTLKRFLRRKVNLVSSLGVSVSRIVKRLKESQAYWDDIFAGNYLFMQVNPSSIKYLEKSFKSHGSSF